MTDAVGRTLAGRSPGVHLNPQGRRQADALARRLSEASPSALYSSPLDRALETAAPLSMLTGLEVFTCADATEIDFGEWTGRSLTELESDARWRTFNGARSREACPGGESMADVQARMLRAVRTLCTNHPGRTIVLVSHADAIRAAICGLAGIPLDLCQRIDIDPASVSTVAIWDDWVVIRGLNR
jgi:probable phosphoglycerate mutase